MKTYEFHLKTLNKVMLHCKKDLNNKFSYGSQCSAIFFLQIILIFDRQASHPSI